jgi:hypothetical protein
LSDSNYYALCYGIVVSGGDVYAVGTESNGQHRIAKYWVNGSEVVLSSGTAQSAQAAAIMVQP